MNEKMKKLLAQIAGIQATAKSFMEGETKDVAKAKAELAKVTALQEEFEVEKALYEAEKAKVPDVVDPPKATAKAMADIEKDEKSFNDFVRKSNSAGLSQGSNGAIVPTTIANKIIEQITELSPIVGMATKYYTKGTLEIPVYGTDSGVDSPTGDISAAYQGTEFTVLTAGQGKFTSIEMKGFSIGSLAVISKKLINNTDIDVTSFVRNKISKAHADKLTRELLLGTADKMTGAVSTTNVKQLATKTVAGITLDSLIELQLLVPQIYQQGAVWIMNKDVFAAIRKMKDGAGNYVMTQSIADGFGWALLGKPVYVDDNMPAATTASGVPVLYGDFSGMALKLAKDVEIQPLIEKYADQNAIGFVGWLEADSKVENNQKIAALKMSV